MADREDINAQDVQRGLPEQIATAPPVIFALHLPAMEKDWRNKNGAAQPSTSTHGRGYLSTYSRSRTNGSGPVQNTARDGAAHKTARAESRSAAIWLAPDTCVSRFISTKSSSLWSELNAYRARSPCRVS
jgi:hypothetical protein